MYIYINQIDINLLKAISTYIYIYKCINQIYSNIFTSIYIYI